MLQIPAILASVMDPKLASIVADGLPSIGVELVTVMGFVAAVPTTSFTINVVPLIALGSVIVKEALVTTPII